MILVITQLRTVLLSIFFCYCALISIFLGKGKGRTLLYRIVSIYHANTQHCIVDHLLLVSPTSIMNKVLLTQACPYYWTLVNANNCNYIGYNWSCDNTIIILAIKTIFNTFKHLFGHGFITPPTIWFVLWSTSKFDFLLFVYLFFFVCLIVCLFVYFCYKHR